MTAARSGSAAPTPSGCSPTRNGCWSCSAPSPRRADRSHRRQARGRSWSGSGTPPPRRSTSTSPATTSAPLRSAIPTTGGTVERLGAATLGLLADWLRRTDRVTIRPVLDPTRISPVDRHDPPDVMREAVILRDGHCVFPGCTVDARSCDLDHIDPYVPPDDGGPPGQTNLREPRLPLPATPPPQDLHRLDLPARTRRQLRVGQPPRHHLHRQPRPRTLTAADPAAAPPDPRGRRACRRTGSSPAPGPKPALDRESFLSDGAPGSPPPLVGSSCRPAGHASPEPGTPTRSTAACRGVRGAPTLRGATTRPAAAPDQDDPRVPRGPRFAQRVVGQEARRRRAPKPTSTARASCPTAP